MSSSIADEITRLSGCRNDILSAISSMGVTVPEGSVLSSCPSLIQSIPTGGGGGSFSAMYNTAVSSGSASASATASVTGVQKLTPQYDYTTYVLTPQLGEINYKSAAFVRIPWSSVSGNTDTKQFVIRIPQMNDPYQISAIATTGHYYDTSNTDWNIKSSYLFRMDSPINPQYQDPSFQASGSIKYACDDLLVYSGSWDDSIELWLGYTFYYASVFYPSTSLYASSVSSVITGSSYPYPDRPTSEVSSFTATASGSEKYVSGAISDYGITWYPSARGTESYCTSTGLAGDSIRMAYTAATSTLYSQAYSYFPTTAYTSTMESSVTTSQSGLF